VNKGNKKECLKDEPGEEERRGRAAFKTWKKNGGHVIEKLLYQAGWVGGGGGKRKGVEREVERYYSEYRIKHGREGAHRVEREAAYMPAWGDDMWGTKNSNRNQ